MTWKDILATAGTAKTITRANSAPGKKTIYQLGAGGADPTLPMTPQCDCSGFIAWSIGVPRELPPGSNHWLNTDCMWNGGGPVKAGAFTPVQLSSFIALMATIPTSATLYG